MARFRGFDMFGSSFRRWLGITFASFLTVAGPLEAHAQGTALTRARIAELVKVSPAARAAAAEVGVARAAVTAADTLSLDNPVISGMAGVRLNPDGTERLAAVATVSWPIDLGGSGARVAAAEAEQRSASATADDSRRRALLAALLQHALVLRDERQVAIAAERRALTQRLLTAAEKHRKAGGVPELDVVLASLQERRDAAAETAAQGARDADTLVLLAMLGLASPGPAASGTLVPEGDPPPLPAALGQVEQRTEMRAATASLDAARARSAREQAARWPTISVLAQYERDDKANIGMLGLAIPLPILNANRTGVAVASAEVDAAAARAAAARSTASGQIKELHARYAATRKTLDAQKPTATLVAQAVALSTRGYELGENDLAGVLLVRREAIEAQAALLEAEHAHANAKIELMVAAGRVPR